MATDKKRPIWLGVRSSKWFILGAMTLAIFTDIFLYSVIVPVVPFALTQRAGIPEGETQYWISLLLAVYGAAILAASPPCGWLADKSPNRRLPLLIGLIALTGATLMLCLGTSIGLIVAGRVLQGVSAAMVWIVGLALLADTFSPGEIGTAMGYATIGTSLAFFLGPLLGGIVYDHAGYFAVFYMCFALLICDIILRIAIIEKKVAVQWKKEAEEPNAPRETPSRANEVSPDDGTAREKITPTEEVNQQHAPLKSSKLPPILLLLKSRRLLVALFGCVIQAIILTAFDTVLPLRLKEIFGWSSTGLGLIFLAIVIPTLASPYIGVLSERYGPRWFVTAGFLLTCPLMICLRFVDHYDIRQIVLLCAILAIIGITMSLILVPYMTEITYVVVAKETKHPGIFGPNGAYAQAYALFNMAYAAGCMIGPIWSGFVSERAGWGTMAWSLGLLSAVTTIPAAIWTGGYIKGKKNEDSVDDTVENIPPV